MSVVGFEGKYKLADLAIPGKEKQSLVDEDIHCMSTHVQKRNMPRWLVRRGRAIDGCAHGHVFSTAALVAAGRERPEKQRKFGRNAGSLVVGAEA
ncbi:hypothetical protein [Streptomyces sp. NPDC127084]|uniref:hypothetical protein n=1 Tax=Streptomyces sp. NPDC127084 TaxID=3347133 RepID=UPI0036481BE8